MTYCTLEEAWGTNSLKEKRVNRKKRTHRKKVYYNETFNSPEVESEDETVNNNYNHPDINYNDYEHHTSNIDYKLKNKMKRGLHNKLSRKNRFRKKKIENPLVDIEVETSNESKRMINSSMPNPISLHDDDYDNYQKLDFDKQDENKALSDDYSEYQNFSQHEHDLEKINNSEFMPRNNVIDNTAPYNDLEDNYHEQGGFLEDKLNTMDNENSQLDETDELLDQEEQDLNNPEMETSINEGFQNNNVSIQNNDLKIIMDRLDTLEKMIYQKKKENSNVHDIILFIIIGIFILFALDSIFKIGKSTI